MLFNIIIKFQFTCRYKIYCRIFFLNYFLSHKNALTHYFQLNKKSNTNSFWSGPYLKCNSICMLYFHWFWYTCIFSNPNSHKNFHEIYYCRNELGLTSFNWNDFCKKKKKVCVLVDQIKFEAYLCFWLECLRFCHLMLYLI